MHIGGLVEVLETRPSQHWVPPGGFSSVLFSVALWLALLFSTACFGAADIDKARESFLKGHYAEAVELCEEGVRDYDYSEEWRLLQIEALLATGSYEQAHTVLTNALEKLRTSIRLRFLGREVMLYNGKDEDAQRMLEEITHLLGTRGWYFRDAANLVVVGRAALLLGVDPRKILDECFEKARKADPKLREAYLAAGHLALDKHDFKLAAKTFGEAVKKFPEDADFHYGLARAYAPSDRRQTVQSLEKALEYNESHVRSFLLLADNLIDGERYDDAREQLEHALEVNPWQPEAWAYRAVIEHLANDAAAESGARSNALRYWKTNPGVDHLIGRKLSQKYRFAEGASRQRNALRFEPKFVPAKTQLAQDLLRLGNEDEGWQLASEVHEDDGYDVTAFNLVTLRETLEKFQTLANEDFLLRMGPSEAPIYGQEALALLQNAKRTLCDKYGLQPEDKTIVEIFPSQKDFAVRTFGMPGNPGYLGVCFGRVITANSPASQGAHPANWQAVLWHEFCHVVTLQLTRNKMPRWLSEGISVYEERLANPAWGQGMTPQYREMILGKDLVPVGELSSAFLSAKTDLHLQFAYYESSLVVEFIVNRFGFESLKNILSDLADGTPINEAIAEHTAALEEIETEFAAFARQRAENLAPELDFKKPDRAEFAGDLLIRKPPMPVPQPKVTTDALDDLPSETSSKNFYVLTRRARKLLEEKKWDDAKAIGEKLLGAFPSYIGPDNAYELLAEVYQGLGQTNFERSILAKLAELDADGADTFLRLMQIAAAENDWPDVKLNAERFFAVNPLVAPPHRYRAQASEALRDSEAALRAWQTLLRLDPPDPAEAHFRVARLLHEKADPAARRHVLRALEEAPRFRDAHRLLLEMHRLGQAAESPGTGP